MGELTITSSMEKNAEAMLLLWSSVQFSHETHTKFVSKMLGLQGCSRMFAGFTAIGYSGWTQVSAENHKKLPVDQTIPGALRVQLYSCPMIFSRYSDRLSAVFFSETPVYFLSIHQWKPAGAPDFCWMENHWTPYVFLENHSPNVSPCFSSYHMLGPPLRRPLEGVSLVQNFRQ